MHMLNKYAENTYERTKYNTKARIKAVKNVLNA